MTSPSTTLPSGSDDLPRALYRKLAWRLLPLASICYAIAIIDRVNIGFAKLEMSADIGLSAASYGLGAGIFFLAYIFFEVPSNMILERVGARVWIARIMVTWGLVTIATGFVQNTEQFYGARILLGIAEAGFYPGLVYFLSSWFPRKRLAQTLALLVVAGPVGSMFVGPLSGYIMTSLGGIAELAGWQWLFVIQGIPAILLGILFFFAMSNSPKDAPWLNNSEKAAIVSAVGSGTSREKAVKQFKSAVTNKSVWILGFILATNYLGVYAVLFWLPTILKNTGVTDVRAIGYLSAIPSAAAVVVTIAVGIYCDRTQKHRPILVVGMTVAAIALVASVATGNQLAPTLIGLSVALAVFTATGPIIWAISNLQLKGMAAAATGIALINSVGSMGSFLGPYIIGLGQEWTGSVVVPILFVAGVCLVGALVSLMVRQRRSTPAQVNSDEEAPQDAHPVVVKGTDK